MVIFYLAFIFGCLTAMTGIWCLVKACQRYRADFGTISPAIPWPLNRVDNSIAVIFLGFIAVMCSSVALSPHEGSGFVSNCLLLLVSGGVFLLGFRHLCSTCHWPIFGWDKD